MLKLRATRTDVDEVYIQVCVSRPEYHPLHFAGRLELPLTYYQKFMAALKLGAKQAGLEVAIEENGFEDWEKGLGRIPAIAGA